MMLFVLFWPFKTFGGSHCTKGSLKYLKLGFYGFCLQKSLYTAKKVALRHFLGHNCAFPSVHDSSRFNSTFHQVHYDLEF